MGQSPVITQELLADRTTKHLRDERGNRVTEHLLHVGSPAVELEIIRKRLDAAQLPHESLRLSQ